jgi:hypothetical protein
MDDPRIGIWDVLHDGEITILQLEAPDVLTMFVSIAYVRRRITPLGDSFRLRLGGFRAIELDNGIGSRYTDFWEIEDATIIQPMSETFPAEIEVAEGKLTIDFDSLDTFLDTGQPISYAEMIRAAQDYWDEFRANAPKA